MKEHVLAVVLACLVVASARCRGRANSPLDKKTSLMAETWWPQGSPTGGGQSRYHAFHPVDVRCPCDDQPFALTVLTLSILIVYGRDSTPLLQIFCSPREYHKQLHRCFFCFDVIGGLDRDAVNRCPLGFGLALLSEAARNR